MPNIDSEAGRRYAGASASERRIDRRTQLIEAALDLILEGGVASLTVLAVCQQAKLSKRYFYESFESLDALLAIALTDVLSDVARTIDLADPRTVDTPAGVVTVAVEAILDAFDDSRVARLYIESAGYPHLLAARERAVAAFVDQLLAMITGRADSTARQIMLAQVLISGTTHVVAMWLSGTLALTRDQFVATLVRLGTETARLVTEPSVDR
ncbi:TetR family transcriptional regulator [Nocardia kruczakiae]|uniref:TetR family transcriptional regulator n=1 Tax=Nocardia kruczakiae TaxID=261477 RepID=UPI0007A46170|nr:TetR family transcriptional regulator [Nocardia kruczakiae]